MAQVDKVDDMKQFADNLVEQQHYAVNEITDRCRAVLDRYKRLLDSMAARKKKLEDSKNYQLFLRHLYEVRIFTFFTKSGNYDLTLFQEAEVEIFQKGHILRESY